jgi:hypothetical protein
MNKKYSFVNTQTNKVDVITDDLYNEIKNMTTDEVIEDFLNVIIGITELPYLNGYHYGTLLRYLAEDASNYDFTAAWEAAKEDFIETSYQAICEDIEWGGKGYFQSHEIIPIMES